MGGEGGDAPRPIIYEGNAATHLGAVDLGVWQHRVFKFLRIKMLIFLLVFEGLLFFLFPFWPLTKGSPTTGFVSALGLQRQDLYHAILVRE